MVLLNFINSIYAGMKTGEGEHQNLWENEASQAKQEIIPFTVYTICCFLCRQRIVKGTKLNKGPHYTFVKEILKGLYNHF